MEEQERNGSAGIRSSKDVQPKVSIIIPVYNQEKYIRECLDSILGQSLKEIEVVLVNDGSTDSSQTIIDEYVLKDDRVISLQQENQGSGPSRNRGLQMARGHFVAFMDPDDYYPSTDILYKLYKHAIEHNVRICGGSLSVTDGKKITTRFYWDKAYGNTFDKAGIIEYRDWQFDVGYTRYIYNRVFLIENKIQFMPFRRFQDPPFFIQAMIAAERFYAIPDITYCYRQTKKDLLPWEWPENIFCDMLRGIKEELRLSREAGLSRLHVLMVRRIEEDGYFEAIYKRLKQGSPEVFRLVLEIYMGMDAKLLWFYEKFRPRILGDVFAWKLLSAGLLSAGENTAWLQRTARFQSDLAASISSEEELEALCRALARVEKGLEIYEKVQDDPGRISEDQALSGKAFVALLATDAAIPFCQGGLKILLKYFSPELVAHALAWKNWDNLTSFSGQLMAFFPGNHPGKKKPKIALYYHRLNGGGVERVISLLVPMFVEMGYEVIVITQDKPTSDDYVLPPEVKREVIYDYRRNTPDKLVYRFRGWKDIIERHDIDLILYEAWIEKVLSWDILYIRLLGIRCVIQTHGIASYAMIRDWNWWTQLLDTYKFAESVITLSEANRFFWSAFHKNVYYLPNPVGKELAETTAKPKHSHVILWIGRFSAEKRPWLAIEVMAEVVRRVSDARLLMVGSEDKGAGLRQKCEKMIKDYGLEENVELCGFTSDVSVYWRQASIHLFTTLFEGFPMVLMEAKGYGLPSVMTELSYLAMSDSGSGVIGIPNMDPQKAAEAVVRLLMDEKEWKRESENARQDFERFLKFDYQEVWRQILEGKKNEKPLNIDAGKIMIRTLAEHHLLGVTTIKKRYNDSLQRSQMRQKRMETQIYKTEERGGKAKESNLTMQKKRTDLTTVYWGALKFINGVNPEKDFIVDEDPKLWGTMVSSLIVCSPEALKNFGEPFQIVLTRSDDKVRQRIKELGYGEQAGFM